VKEEEQKEEEEQEKIKGYTSALQCTLGNRADGCGYLR
jgi:hypothetical protein